MANLGGAADKRFSLGVMNNTTRHIAAALVWMVALPLGAVALFASGALPSSELHSTVVSLVWGLGVVAVFASWALRDAPSHGKSRGVALGFTAAWFLVFCVAVFPYLFFTRGVKGGLAASLKFISLCLGFAVFWLGVPMVISRLF